MVGSRFLVDIDGGGSMEVEVRDEKRWLDCMALMANAVE